MVVVDTLHDVPSPKKHMVLKQGEIMAFTLHHNSMPNTILKSSIGAMVKSVLPRHVPMPMSTNITTPLISSDLAFP